MTADNPAAFQGAAQHPTLGSIEVAGGLDVTSEGVRFECGAARLTIPLAQLQIDLTRDRRVRFTDPLQPDLAIFTREDRILALPVFGRQPQLKERAARIRAALENRALMRVAMWIAIFLGGCILILWMLSGMLVDFILRNVPPSWEIAMGQAFAQSIEPQVKKTQRPEWDRQLNAITLRFTKTTSTSPYEFSFQVIEDPLPNAFALPGGRVFVHSGLLASARQPEEVAGVLAHEMAHVNLRHGLRQLVKSSVPRFLLQVFIGDQEGMISLASQGSQVLLRQRYSRDAEREADRTGWQYLMDANIDPRGLIEFFKRLAADPKLSQLDNPALTIFSSHPATTERVEYLQFLWESSPRKGGFDKIKADPK